MSIHRICDSCGRTIEQGQIYGAVTIQRVIDDPVNGVTVAAEPIVQDNCLRCNEPIQPPQEPDPEPTPEDPPVEQPQP